MSYDINHDTLQTEEATLQKEFRIRRRGLWIGGTFAAGMAIWAAFWIAITIANGWDAIYIATSGLSLGLFLLGVAAAWLSSEREPQRAFGNSRPDELRRSLALIDYKLSVTERSLLFILGAASISIGAMLFSWTVSSSQDIPDSSFSGYARAIVGLAVLFAWACYKVRDEMRKEQPKLEIRQRRLRELLAGLQTRE